MAGYCSGPLHRVIPLGSPGPVQCSQLDGPQTKFLGRCLSHPVSSWRGGLKLMHLGGCQKVGPSTRGCGRSVEVGPLWCDGLPTEVVVVVVVVVIVVGGRLEVGEVGEIREVGEGYVLPEMYVLPEEVDVGDSVVFLVLGSPFRGGVFSRLYG